MMNPLLTEITDIPSSRLSPGTYFASSLTDGYGALLALVEADEALYLGESIQPEGVKLVAVQVGKKRNPPMQTIGISREFFTTVLKDYEDWKLKWWREAIQNAVDAGANKIDCTILHNEDGTVTVSVSDNGGGMDEDVLINKFLMLGGSTKQLGSGAAGGFGKAKELLILPWLSWTVHTRDRIIRGEGISYTVHEAPHLEGTTLEATMPADQHTQAAAAESFISRCYLPNIRFTVMATDKEGKTTSSRPKAKLQSVDLVSDVPGKVEIYVAPVDYVGRKMYVRVNGLYMFDRWMGETPDKQVIAEITAPSIEILTANRDGFRDYEVRNAVDALVERVTKDVKSGLRSAQGLIRKKYEGVGKFQAKQLTADALSEMGRVEFTDKGVTEISSFNIERLAELLQHASRSRTNVPDGDLTKELLSSINYGGAYHVEEAVKLLVWEPDFFIINENEGFKIPPKFLPETMRPQVVKLIRTWTEMCRYVLMQLGNFRAFGVGFIFDKRAAAAYLAEEDEHWLLLNPFVEPYTPRETWKPTNQEHLKRLYALAIHECTHLADGLEYHDESFTSALTMNIAKTSDGFRKLRKISNAIKMSDRPLVDVRSKLSKTKKPTSVNQLKNKLLR